MKSTIFRVPRLKKREGITLVDMALAILVASIAMFSVVTVVADAQKMRVEADRIAVAVSAAQIKLAQLLSNPELSTTNERGTFGPESGIYSGYTWEVEIREEKIDLAKVAESGQLKGIELDDKLPAGVQNKYEDEKLGQSESTQTGGLVDIVRIIVTITYPRGGGISGVYRVETFRGAKNKT